MMVSCFLDVIAGLLLVLFAPGDDVFYRNAALQEVRLNPVGGEFHIRDDANEEVQLSALIDTDGVLYWYRRINTPVCLTGECKLVDVGLFWDCTGDFFGIEVYGEHLTKTDHSIFSPEDYARLIDILENDWSILREYEFTELTQGKPEAEANGVDAISGATRHEIASEAVPHAVYTTYTLWHLVHGGEKEKLMVLTVGQLLHDSLRVNLLQSGKKKYQLFLLDLFAQGKVDQDVHLTRFALNALEWAKDPDLVNLALNALQRMDLGDTGLQLNLARIYSAAPEELRLRLLVALKHAEPLSQSLYSVLEDDLRDDNDWYSMRILDVLVSSERHSEKVIAVARELAQSNISHVRISAENFLKKLGRKN